MGAIEPLVLSQFGPRGIIGKIYKGTTKQCNILNRQALASVVLEKTFPIISLYGRYLFVWTTKHCYIHNIEALGLVFPSVSR